MIPLMSHTDEKAPVNLAENVVESCEDLMAPLVAQEMFFPTPGESLLVSRHVMILGPL